MDRSLFDALRREWTNRNNSAEAARVFATLERREPAVTASGARSLSELLARCDRRNANAVSEPWAVLTAVVRQLGESELLMLGLLVALIPTMQRIGKRLEWGADGPWAERTEFVGELISTCWMVLNELSGSTLAYPIPPIRRRIIGRLKRLRARATNASLIEMPTLFDDLETEDELVGSAAAVFAERSLADPHPIPVLDELAQAICNVESTSIDRLTLQIVYARRVLGYPIREISTLLGVREDHVEYRAMRGEWLLCAS